MVEINKSRLGGLRRVELYGNPGTLEGRRRGGLKTQERIRINPDFAKKTGITARKKISKPKESGYLAEFVGIFLGDGGFRNNWQITISFNIKEDREYEQFVQRLIKKLFSVTPSLSIREKYGAGDIVVTATELVEYLEKIGLRKGNKVLNQIDIPEWLFKRRVYQAACLRGLMDTDGSVYLHKYKVNGTQYCYPKLCFASLSRPLLDSANRIFKNFGFNPRIRRNKTCLYIENSSEVDRYFREVGTHNPRYKRRFEAYRDLRDNNYGEVA